VTDQIAFFRGLGQRVRDLRKKNGFTQEDMISFGFSARHWQQIEAGRPITLRTLLRIGEVFNISLANLVIDLDDPCKGSGESSRPLIKKLGPKGKKEA
jgi:transcriptional regulator with XRE-family HTH domain